MNQPDPSTARVEEILAAMTVEEQASLTGGDDVWHLPPIERLGIGRLKMSDGPSGVRGERIGTRRSLSFPCGLAVGATWDVDLVDRYGGALADEAQAKGVHLLLGPTICIPRTPLAGRTFESLAEDPHLSARLTVAYVRGVQNRGVGCCVKHFAANDQEHERMTISAEVDEAVLREIHLPSFEAAVTEAGAWSVMSAYNRLNGTFCGEHPWLLDQVLRQEWGFDGVVVSDWFGTHSTEEASRAGLDVEMPGPPAHLGYRLAEAVEAGTLPAGVLQEHARRVLRLAHRTGLLDETEARPAVQDPEDLGRRTVARELATAATVLLRNESSILPLDPAVTSVAVIGPNADLIEVGGGGSSQVMPHRPTSFVQELRDRLGPNITVTHEVGCSIDREEPDLDVRLLDDGFDLDYIASPDLSAPPVETEKLWVSRFVALGDPVPGVQVRSCALRATGTFRADVSGTWRLGVANAGRARILIDGEVLVDNTDPTPGAFFYGVGSTTVSAPVELIAGEPHTLTIEFTNDSSPVAGFVVSATRPEVPDAMQRAVAAAAEAEVAIVVVGSNAQWESEGADRPNLDLVGDQDELVKQVAAVNPRTVVVVNAGAPVTMPWADQVAGVIMLWYPGEEGAAALADIVTGTADPGGRLPITFPTRIEDTPPQRTVAGAGRSTKDQYPGTDGTVTYGEGLFVGYRHYDEAEIEPAFCFGHGLSYATFEVGVPHVDPVAATVEVPVTNTSHRLGTEVIQVYVEPVDRRPERPIRELRGFAKLSLDPGGSETVRIDLDPRAFSRWDAARGTWLHQPGDWIVAVGRSSRDLPHRIPVTVA